MSYSYALFFWVKIIVYPDLMKEKNAFQNIFFSHDFRQPKQLLKIFQFYSVLVRAVFDPNVRSLVGKEWNGKQQKKSLQYQVCQKGMNWLDLDLTFLSFEMLNFTNV